MISATLGSSGSPAALLIAHARAGNIRIDISDPILNETLGLLRGKFQWNGYLIQDTRGKLLSLGNHVLPTVTLHIVQEDPDDDRILECAATAGSDFIVSEDKARNGGIGPRRSTDEPALVRQVYSKRQGGAMAELNRQHRDAAPDDRLGPVRYAASGHPSVDQLMAEQGTGPITDVSVLHGDFWPEEESIENFLDTLHQWRGHKRTDPVA